MSGCTACPEPSYVGPLMTAGSTSKTDVSATRFAAGAPAAIDGSLVVRSAHDIDNVSAASDTRQTGPAPAGDRGTIILSCEGSGGGARTAGRRVICITLLVREV